MSAAALIRPFDFSFFSLLSALTMLALVASVFRGVAFLFRASCSSPLSPWVELARALPIWYTSVLWHILLYTCFSVVISVLMGGARIAQTETEWPCWKPCSYGRSPHCADRELSSSEAYMFRQSWRRAEDGLVASFSGVDIAQDGVRWAALVQLKVGSLSPILTGDPPARGGRGTAAARFARSTRAHSSQWLCRVACL